jgi:hypothetical protein
MEPKTILAEALQAVNGADIPEDLREAAFSKAVDIILLRQNGSTGFTTPTIAPTVGNAPSGTSVQGDDQDVVDKIAQSLHLDPNVVGRVFREVDGEPHLNLLSSQLSGSKTGATREIALLIVAGRSAAGLDEFTPVAEIRKEAEHFNKFDSSNFAAAIKRMNNYFRVRGSSQSREVRLNQPGREAAVTLINRLGGGEN